jgi:hypothetical protein
MFQVTQILAHSGHVQKYITASDSRGQQISAVCLTMHILKTTNCILHIYTLSTLLTQLQIQYKRKIFKICNSVSVQLMVHNTTYR